MTTDASRALYDRHCRGASEVRNAYPHVVQVGPVWVGVRGTEAFASYTSLGTLRGDAVETLIDDVIATVEDRGATRLEWKVRGHDQPADLVIRLLIRGFVPEIDAGIETVMMGPAAAVAERRASGPVLLPDGRQVHVRRLTWVPRDGDTRGQLLQDTARVLAMQDAVFGRPSRAVAVEEQWDRWGEQQAYVYAECEGDVVCAGKLTCPDDGEVAGLWGGATRPELRRQGLYVAVAAERAAIAVERGLRYVMSDALPTSRPLLERCGLRPVTTTTPMIWTATTT